MSKLVATYAEGMFAVFTEDRSGMRQRALIDIGSNTPTPKEMADLAGVLSDQWGWANPIDKPRPVRAIGGTKGKGTRDNSDPKMPERQTLIVDWLKANPGQHDAREIVKGCGFEDTDQRLGRWHHAFLALMAAKLIKREIFTEKVPNGPLIRKNVYSLP